MKAIPIGQLRRLVAPMLALSMITNLSILVSPIFMMQVLDRVVPSANNATLILLLFVALLALVATAIAEAVRDRCLSRVTRWVQGSATPAILAQPPAAQPELLAQLSRMRHFLNGNQVSSLLNLVWVPLFLVALFLINPLYALLVIVIIAVMQLVSWSVENISLTAEAAVNDLAKTEVNQISQFESWSLQPRMLHIRDQLAGAITSTQARRFLAEDIAEGSQSFGTAFRSFIRLASQLVALSLGAYLVAQNLQTAGAMIAASIVTAKTISTVEQSLGTLKELPKIRESFQAISNLKIPEKGKTDVVDLSGSLTCANLIYPRGEGAPPRLDRISFELKAGECLVIIGDSASGKSSLLNVLAGLDNAPIGSVTLDQSDIKHLGSEACRTQIGYLPQHATLMSGTVLENIAGFDGSVSDAEVIETAKAARIHGLISALPQGYNTDVFANPHLLTAGQKQQIALAGVMLHRPKYLFLDEPNSLLDRHAERTLCGVLSELKEGGTTIVMILHRSGAIGLADKVLAMERGRMADFGPRAEVLSRQHDGNRRITLPLRETSLQDLADWITVQFTRGGDLGFSGKAVLLGSELFQAAFLNGPRDRAREVHIAFKFLDEQNCEMRMVEEGFTAAEEVMVKVNAALDLGEIEETDFDISEKPLVCARKLASRLEVKNGDKHATFFASLCSDDVAGHKGLPN